MPGTIIDMSKIKQVLQLSMNGISNHQIAKALSIDKETVNNYISKAKRETLSFKELIKLDDPVLERRFHFGNPAYSDERLQTFMELLPFFVEELSNKHVTRYNVWQNYREAYPNGYGRSQFFFHLGQNLEAKKKPSTVLYGSYNPGEKIFVDFAGDTLSYVNRDSGEIIKIQVFVASMPYTDYAFAMCVPSQKVEDFLYALRMCFEYLGGVPKIVVTDNLKSAVIKADKYEPTLNKALEDMGNHYGFVVIPCQPASPTQKALVENQVKLIYHRIYSKLRNRQFFSLQEINEAVWELLKAHNQTRMQQRTYSREEHFFSVEKGVLKPLPATPYQMRYYSDVTVQQNSHVYLSRDKHYYSVPYILIGRRAKIIYTSEDISC